MNRKYVTTRHNESHIKITINRKINAANCTILDQWLPSVDCRQALRGHVLYRGQSQSTSTSWTVMLSTCCVELSHKIRGDKSHGTSVVNASDLRNMFPPILFVFLVTSILHRHPALLRRQALILDRLLTFLVAFFTFVLKPFYPILSLHSRLSLFTLISWNLTTRSLVVTGGDSVVECGTLSQLLSGAL